MSITEMHLPDGRPRNNLKNIADTLRSMADKIDAGEDQYASSLVWVSQKPGEHAELGCIGEYLDTNQVIGILTRAIHWLASNPKASR